MDIAHRHVSAPRGPELSCRGSSQEAALRMLMDNLDPEVAERPGDLVVDGGSGRAARSRDTFDAIVATLRRLERDDTLVVQSGKPAVVSRTHLRLATGCADEHTTDLGSAIDSVLRWRENGMARSVVFESTAADVQPELVRRGVTPAAAPIAIGRDHLDAGSVASPNRETAHMRDGSNAIAARPIPNALPDTPAGTTRVSVQPGGGVGIGQSIRAGMIVVADASSEAGAKLERVLTYDPGTGVDRHADAGYPEAAALAAGAHIDMPMRMAGGVGR